MWEMVNKYAAFVIELDDERLIQKKKEKTANKTS